MGATPSAFVVASNLLVMAVNKAVFVFPCSQPVGTNTVLANLVPPLLLPLCPF